MISAGSRFDLISVQELRIRTDRPEQRAYMQIGCRRTQRPARSYTVAIHSAILRTFTGRKTGLAEDRC